MSSEALNSNTGMPRKEIELRLEAGILKAREELVERSRAELAVINLELNKINVHNVTVGHRLANLEQGQSDLHTGQDVLRAKLLTVESTTQEILAKVTALSVQTVTIEEETEDGRKIVKHFTSWRTAWGDLRGAWKEIIAAFLAYKLVGGFLAEHGITWMSLFAGAWKVK